MPRELLILKSSRASSLLQGIWCLGLSVRLAEHRDQTGVCPGVPEFCRSELARELLILKSSFLQVFGVLFIWRPGRKTVGAQAAGL